MKTLIVGTVLGAAAVTSTFAQGNVIFNNNNATKISINTGETGPATGLLPANDGTLANTFYFALFVSPTATTVGGNSGPVTGFGSYAFQDPNWTLAETASGPAIAENIATPGRLASLVAGPDGYTTTLENAGPADYFVVVGWSGNIGSSIASVESFLDGTDGGVTSGYLGESNVSGLIYTGDEPIIPDAELFGKAPGYINTFVLSDPTVVPEPSTIALGIMGVATLLGFRRNQA